MARAKSSPTDSSANIGFEAKLWLSADELCNNMDAAVTVCLGFLAKNKHDDPVGVNEPTLAA